MNLQENIHRIKEVMGVKKSIKKTFGEETSISKIGQLDKSTNDWENSNYKLKKTFKFKDFEESIDFVNKVAKISEKQKHHPDIIIKYGEVEISISDHDKGGVSDKCLKFVKAVDKMKNRTFINR